MAKYVIDSTTLSDIANSIRTKKGTTDNITPEAMPSEIASITTAENLDAVLTEQEALIAELQEVLKGKASGGGTDILDALIDKSITEISSGAKEIGNNAFYYCYHLAKVDLLSAESISTSVFYRCHSLVTLILRSSEVCTLTNTNAFTYCHHILGTTDATYNPNGDKDGYIYVPKNLLSAYQSASNWSTLKTQFRAIEDYPEICGGGA